MGGGVVVRQVMMVRVLHVEKSITFGYLFWR